MRKFSMILASAVALLLFSCADNGDDGNSVVNGDGSQDPGNSITLDHVDGLVGGDIPLGQVATFHIRLANSTGVAIKGITNGIRVFSPNGAQWTATIGDSTGAITAQMMETRMISHFSVTGSGADTIGFSGFVFHTDGIPDGFDAVCYEITIGPVNAAAGRSICLDSSFYEPSGVWKWAGSGFAFFPGWDGPHCYTIGE